MPKSKILIVEDDRSLAEVLYYNFSSHGYEIFRAYDGQDGLNQARFHKPDLIILDVMIPVLDGLEVCRELRSDSATKRIPILMLTAKSDEADQLVGFTMGADDYVAKPFSVKVLLERVKSLLRRSERATATPSGDIVSCGGITIDRIKHRVSIADQAVDLTLSEFRLLDTLMRQPGRAFDRSELIDAALGSDALVLERTIDVHIRSLRKKLNEFSQLIQTVRGIGYRFCETSVPTA